MRTEIRSLRKGLLLPLLMLTALTTGLVAQVDVDAGNPGGVRPPLNRAFQAIQEPEDPSQVRGSFELGGTRRVVTEGEFYNTYLLLKPHLEQPNRPLQAMQVLEHILLYAEAEAMGLAPTEAEIARMNPAKMNPTFADQMRMRWKQQGITEEEFERYLKETRAIARLRSWFTNALRVTSQQVFNLWKNDNYLYGVNAVIFRGDANDGREPTEEELRDFWTTNSAVQEQYRTPTTITAQLMVFDPSRVTEAEIARLRAEQKIERKDALAYFQANRERLMAQIPSSERPKLYPPAGERVAVEELVTPFQLLEPIIERELLIGDRIAKAFKEVGRAADSDAWKATANALGLDFRKVDGLTRDEFVRDHNDLGTDLWATLYGAAEGQAAEAVAFHGNLRYFWRMENRVDASLPNFDEVKDDLLPHWKRESAWQAALEMGNRFTGTLDAMADQDLAEEFAQVDASVKERAEADIKARNITDERAKQATYQRFQTFAENQKRAKRAEVRGRHFEAAAEKLGLTIEPFGPFAFDVTRLDGADAIDVTKEQIEDFLASSYQFRTLQVGQVTQLMTDSVLRCHAVCQVTSREEPDFEDMPAIEFHQKRVALERQVAYQTTYQWTGYTARTRLKWTDGK